MSTAPVGNQRTLGSTLVWAHVLAAIVGAFVMFITTLNVSGCAQSCRYETLEFSSKGFWILDLLILLGATGSYCVFRSRLLRAWLIPAFGIVTELLALLVALVLFRSAL